jgi:hypothetical protein
MIVGPRRVRWQAVKSKPGQSFTSVMQVADEDLISTKEPFMKMDRHGEQPLWWPCGNTLFSKRNN